jgi:hypothetical protein
VSVGFSSDESLTWSVILFFDIINWWWWGWDEFGEYLNVPFPRPVLLEPQGKTSYSIYIDMDLLWDRSPLATGWDKAIGLLPPFVHIWYEPLLRLQPLLPGVLGFLCPAPLHILYILYEETRRSRIVSLPPVFLIRPRARMTILYPFGSSWVSASFGTFLFANYKLARVSAFRASPSYAGSFCPLPLWRP